MVFLTVNCMFLGYRLSRLSSLSRIGVFAMNYEITCCVCGKKLIGDGEPCCGDIVCVAVMNHEFDKSEAVIEVEKILYNEWLEMKAAEYGI
jgi:hypothetical protein